MAYDAEVADDVREYLAKLPDVREVKMFGGLAFMVDDRMVVCVSGGGGALLVRVSREQDEKLIERPGAHRAEMGKGRSMGEGWITVDRDSVSKKKDLDFWMREALEFHAAGSGKEKKAKKK